MKKFYELTENWQQIQNLHLNRRWCFQFGHKLLMRFFYYIIPQGGDQGPLLWRCPPSLTLPGVIWRIQICEKINQLLCVWVGGVLAPPENAENSNMQRPCRGYSVVHYTTALRLGDQKSVKNWQVLRIAPLYHSDINFSSLVGGTDARWPAGHWPWRQTEDMAPDKEQQSTRQWP